MITIDEMEEMLEEIAENVPEAFYQDLNGGILLLPEKVVDKENAKHDDLFILGEYCQDEFMGNYINIYYGSFAALMPNATRDEMYKELEETLLHEFTHHIEILAGEEGLDKKDMEELDEYLKTGEYLSPKLIGWRPGRRN